MLKNVQSAEKDLLLAHINTSRASINNYIAIAILQNIKSEGMD